jgi:hypothetical protein
MATPCYITVKINDKLYKTVYCNWDGYPSHTGKILLKYYNSQEKAESIVNLGNLSFLDKSVECPEGHSFNTPIKGYSVFYDRDRGEDDNDAIITDEYIPKRLKEKYLYFWNGEKWFCNEKELIFDNP